MAEAQTAKISRSSIREGDLLFGVAMFILFLIGITLQTATTEAYGQAVQDTTVWNLFVSTLQQIPGLFTGQVYISELPKLLFGWGVELFYYGCITGHKRMKQSVEHHHPWAIAMLDVFAIACVGYCWFTDWQYAVKIIPNFWGQVFFAAIISAMVAYCGAAGWHFIKSGFGR